MRNWYVWGIDAHDRCVWQMVRTTSKRRAERIAYDEFDLDCPKAYATLDGCISSINKELIKRGEYIA